MAVQEAILGPYNIGEAPTLVFFFTQNKTGADPASPAIKLTPPGGPSTVYTTANGLTHIGNGVYHLTISLTIDGSWTGRSYATGLGETSRPFKFEVEPDPHGNYP